MTFLLMSSLFMAWLFIKGVFLGDDDGGGDLGAKGEGINRENGEKGI
jgi:hypothetical protein